MTISEIKRNLATIQRLERFCEETKKPGPCKGQRRGTSSQRPSDAKILANAFSKNIGRIAAVTQGVGVGSLGGLLLGGTPGMIAGGIGGAAIGSGIVGKLMARIRGKKAPITAKPIAGKPTKRPTKRKAT